MRRLHDRAFEDQNVERLLARDQRMQQLLEIIAQFNAERRMPKNVDAEIGDEIACTRFFGIQKRHGVARTGTALKPEEISHATSRCARKVIRPA